MLGEIAKGEIKEALTNPDHGEFQKIKPIGEINMQECRDFWDKVFGGADSIEIPGDIIRQYPREHPTDPKLPTDVVFVKQPDTLINGEKGSDAGSTVCKTDDNGKIYSTDGKLNPNDTYELNGNIYKTDKNGRIFDIQAKPTLTPENARDNDAQKDAGGNDRREGDQGGHIVGRDMGGDSGEGNLVAMDSKINQSDYKRMENDIKRELSDGKEVTTHTEISYSGNSERPDKIKVTVTVDGKETVYTFDNNIDGSLREKVGEIGGRDAAETVQSVLDEKSGEISSIKEEYDKSGNLEKATVNVTYTDETGTTQRTRIVIDHPQGGNS